MIGRGRGRPPGSFTRYTPNTLRTVWVAIETMRRTNPSRWAHVDDACHEFARRGLVEVHPDQGEAGVFWASAEPLTGALGQVVSALTRTRAKRKPQHDAPESLRKMYDKANARRRADGNFRALLDSTLRNSLVSYYHRQRLAAPDVGPAETIALLSPSPEQLAEILAMYPEPPKFRIRRRAPR